jgi:CRP-like cAMP-binding protein
MDNILTTSAIEKITPFLVNVGGTFVIYASQNKSIRFRSQNKQYVYYLTEGEVDMHREVDDILLLTMQAPKILGLSLLNSDECFHYMKTTKNSKLIAIEQAHFCEVIEANNLWKEVFTITSSIVKSYFKRDERFCSKSVYDVIKNNLEVLWDSPPGERKKTSIFKYILSRSDMSRSSLSKVLKDLNDGGYITISRGKLLNVRGVA